MKRFLWVWMVALIQVGTNTYVDPTLVCVVREGDFFGSFLTLKTDIGGFVVVHSDWDASRIMTALKAAR